MTFSVKSIAISLAIMAMALPASACIWEETHNYYLFSVRGNNDFAARAKEKSDDFWKAYLHQPSSGYFYFDSDEVMEEASRRGDQPMADYVSNLKLYLDCCGEVAYEQWDYPTKEQLEQRRQTLLKVKEYAANHLSGSLGSRHALLLMRCQMLLGQHRENIAFWEQTASRGENGVLKEMMLDIYAGALDHSGRSDEAAQIFASLGDWSSLMTQYYKRRSCKAIEQEYNRDNNAAVLPFLLQDFVNNAQEAVDTYEEGIGGTQGKLFVRNIKKSEAMQMCQLAQQAVKQGKTTQPALWQSAKAWLEYLFGNERQAQADIRQATHMKGSPRVKDCARVLRLYITAANTSKTSRKFDNYMAAGLHWLDAMAFNDYHYSLVKDRLVHLVLSKTYSNQGRPETALALLKSVGAYCHGEYLDTMSIENMQRYMDYAKSPGTSVLDKYLSRYLQLDSVAMNDMMGTKHLRLCHWKEAQEWLSRVPTSYYSEKGYAVYAANRRPSVEPWMKRQWLSSKVLYSDQPVKLKENPKLAFAREMQSLEEGMAKLDNKQQLQRCYDLAARYAQVSVRGDCWFIMRDGIGGGDTVRVGETDFQAKAVALLKKAAQTTDAALKEKVLFALSYGGLYSIGQEWYTTEWVSEKSDFVRRPAKDRQQYKAFAELAKYEQAAYAVHSGYVSRCDEYKQFLKQFK